MQRSRTVARRWSSNLWGWFGRLFGQKQKPAEARVAALGVVRRGDSNDTEKSANRVEERPPARFTPRSAVPTVRLVAPVVLTLSRGTAEPKEEGQRAEIVIQPEDSMGLPVLPAELAPKTTASRRLVCDPEAPTLRLPRILAQAGPEAPPTTEELELQEEGVRCGAAHR